MEGCGFKVALSRLEQHYGSNGTAGPTRASPRKPEPLITAERVRESLKKQGFTVAAKFHFSEDLRKIRFEHKTKTQPGKGKPEKTFRWEHREAGRWWFGKGDKDTPLYVNATFRKRDQAGIVVGFEGEAKADVAGDLGFSAFSYKDGLSETSVGVLSGCEVALWPDKDEAGTNYALNSAETISEHGQVRSLTIIEPHENLPEGGDIVDAVQTLGCGTEEISSLIDSAVPYAQSPRKKEQQAVTWPRPQPIASELPPVQPFREELLPSSFRALVQDVANRMQVPLDYPAAIAVLCLAGAVNRRARIQPKANDPSWLVVPNLWGGIVAPPGMLKSPLITCITKPLTDIQAGWHEEHKEDLARYEQEHEEWTLRQQAWKEEFKRLTVCQGRSKFGPLRRSKSRPVGEGVAVFVGRLERSLRSPFRAAQA